MPIQAGTVVNQCRLLGAVPNTNQGRWADPSLLSLIDMAQKHLVQELLFPETRLTANAITNVQLYQVPDAHRLYRVYLNGQICVETSINTMEGRQIGLYDTTGQGVLTLGSDAPTGGTVGVPKWAVLTPQAAPYLSNLGAPALTSPSGVGMQYRYYKRSGSIGFVPAPGNAAEITIDGVFPPPDLTADIAQLEVPSYFYDALVWYTVMMMKFADDTSSTQDQRNFAEGKYQEHLKKLRTTVRQYSLQDLTTMVRTDRHLYAFGRRTTGGMGNSN